MKTNKIGEVGIGIVLFFVLLLIVLVVIFLLFGNKIEFTKNTYDKFLGGETVVSEKTVNTPVIVSPPENVNWCKIQDIKVGNSREDYISDKIVGWDSVSNCCVREVMGFNCALQKETLLQYCYDAIIGGQVKWLMIDGIYNDKSLYKEFVEDLDKEHIDIKQCNIKKYAGK